MATAAAAEQPAGRFAKDHLKAFVERVERLEEEKKAIGDDIRDVYAEAKASGFDVKALRTIVRLRKQDADERREQEAILETYLHALENPKEARTEPNPFREDDGGGSTRNCEGGSGIFATGSGTIGISVVGVPLAFGTNLNTSAAG